MHLDPPSALLDRVRKLLAKAEAEGVTPPEAEALTAKAAELMARYGIDRARLAASEPGTDRPGSRIIDIANPWAQVRAHLLAQDVIWVGGGSTANLLALWRLHGLDVVLRECWEAGVVLKGVSAVLVTPEPMGGSPHPTHTPVISFPLD